MDNRMEARDAQVAFYTTGFYSICAILVNLNKKGSDDSSSAANHESECVHDADHFCAPMVGGAADQILSICSAVHFSLSDSETFQKTETTE
jgi:hypothetical protein